MQFIENRLLNTPHKRIVFDIDDTLSFTISRDWENATPNEPLIQKINKLFDEGWEIFLITARGSISCKSRGEAYEKYGEQLIHWLRKHKVNYHKLSFDKELAAYYVDDKGITPEDFLELNIKTIKQGWSGATVELRDGKIYKTHSNSKDVALWYDIAKNYVNIPKVHSLIGDTLCLEFINNNTDCKIEDIVSILNTFSKMPSPMYGTFADYFNRIENHIKSNETDFPELESIWKNLVNKLRNKKGFSQNGTETLFEVLDKPNHKSFCHGDFSLDNILCQDGKVILIDPIFETNKQSWNSWLLDLSKLLMSLRKNNRMYQYKHLVNIFNDYFSGESQYDKTSLILYLEIFQWIRILKYAPKDEKEKIYEQICQISETILK